MSEVRLLIRELDREFSGTIHGSCADCAVAALSADPETFEELEAAVARFDSWQSAHGHYFGNLSAGDCDEPYDAGLVVIDLAARLVVVDSTYSCPGQRGTIWRHDAAGRDYGLPYSLADDWHFEHDALSWRYVAERRRSERLPAEPLDARAVFYGRALLEFVARETFAAFGRREEIKASVRKQWKHQARARLAKEQGVTADEVDPALLTEKEITPQTWSETGHYASPFYDTLKEIHAAWLLTPRDDLHGRTPREVALERHKHIESDLQNRCTQWSLTGECPPGLAKDSHAYRFAPFGTHEIVKYYDLVRELLCSSWERLEQLSQSAAWMQNFAMMMPGDFLTEEVPRLEQVREQWLDSPDEELDGRTPRSIMERERLRLPEGMPGHDAMIDPDCPCCQAMADFGPAFWHLDGSGMDDDFAFDLYHATRDEWEAEQRRSEEWSRKFNAEWAERERMGLTHSTTNDEGTDDPWERSYVIGVNEHVPLGMHVFGVGCHLAEIIAELRDEENGTIESDFARQSIDRLNREFGNLREVLRMTDLDMAQALLDPVVDRFVDTLRQVGFERDGLTERCESLIDSLGRLLAPAEIGPLPDSEDDGDLPF